MASDTLPYRQMLNRNHKPRLSDPVEDALIVRAHSQYSFVQRHCFDSVRRFVVCTPES